MSELLCESPVPACCTPTPAVEKVQFERVKPFKDSVLPYYASLSFPLLCAIAVHFEGIFTFIPFLWAFLATPLLDFLLPDDFANPTEKQMKELGTFGQVLCKWEHYVTPTHFHACED
jgi:hypothetical protein